MDETSNVTVRSREELEAVLGSGNYRRIAEEVGVTRQHVSRILRGLSGVGFRTACGIADSAEVTLEELWRWVRGARDRRAGAAKAEGGGGGVNGGARSEKSLAQAAKMQKMRDGGKSDAEIAASMGVSREWVGQLLGRKNRAAGAESRRVATFDDARRVADEAGKTLDELRGWVGVR